MKRIIIPITAIFVALLMSSCATLFNSNLQTVKITSSNSRAIEGKINGFSFKGPTEVAVSRSYNDLVVETSTKGCEATTRVPSKLDGIFWWNILNAFQGLIADLSSEEMWEYDNEVVIQCGK